MTSRTEVAKKALAWRATDLLQKGKKLDVRTLCNSMSPESLRGTSMPEGVAAGASAFRKLCQKDRVRLAELAIAEHALQTVTIFRGSSLQPNPGTFVTRARINMLGRRTTSLTFTHEGDIDGDITLSFKRRI